MNLKGTLGFYKVDPDQIAQSVSFLESLGANVVVLISGKMTRQQRLKAREYATLRVDVMLEAVKWLCTNNSLWKNVNVDEWRAHFQRRTPFVRDESTEVPDGTDPNEENIEVMEKFSVFYPDEMHQTNGGQRSPDEFRAMVQHAKDHGFDVEYVCQLDREFIQNECKNNALMHSNLLQFPYGRGGPNETRVDENGHVVDKAKNIDRFVSRLSFQSLPQFHRPLFCLILYNLGLRKKALHMSSMVIENGTEAEMIVNSVDGQDLERAAAAMANGSRAGSYASNTYLRKVKAVAGCLPHSNEASGKAAMKMESMHHNLGAPNVFLTFTFDDENSFLVQVMAETEIDDDQDIGILTDDELRTRAQRQNELRLKYPGLCAMAFDDLLDIVLEEVMGWDRRLGRGTGRRGLFGTCIALSFGVEEQGRKTLHVHLIAWTREMQQLYKRLLSDNSNERQSARASLALQFDDVLNTEMFGNPSSDKTTKKKFLDVFDHVCEIDKADRELPKVVFEQQLRNLRHKYGHQSQNGLFLYCSHCATGRWTNEQAIEAFLKRGVGVDGLTRYPDGAVAGGPGRLHAMIIAHQNPNNNMVLQPIINHAAYDNHLSCHTKTCFRCYKKAKGSRLTPSDYECRSHLPQLPNPYSTFLEEIIHAVYFMWTGEACQIPWFRLKPKRMMYDLFQNQSCKCISESKISGNSNCTMLMPGPVFCYTCKYPFKKNQAEEQQPYKKVVSTTKKMLLEGRKHEGNRSEAMRRILRATFQHNTENVVGAAMAAFLTRNGTRFYFSHTFAWIPIEDMVHTLNGRSVRAIVKQQGQMKIVQKRCHDYLCRNTELESITFWEMIRDYKTEFLSKANGNNILPFEACVQYEHPSLDDNKKARQGLQLKEIPDLVQVAQRLFEDTGNFKADILDPCVYPTAVMNQYALWVLVMFFPYRCLDDLHDGQYNYVIKLREAFSSGELMKGFNEILQNIQDAKHNYLRHRTHDDLDKITEVFRPDKDTCDFDMDDDVVDDEEEQVCLMMADEVFQELEKDQNDEYQSTLASMSRMSFDRVKARGQERLMKHVDALKNHVLTEEERGGESNLVQFVGQAVPTLTTPMEEDLMTPSQNETDDDYYESPRRRDIHKLCLMRENTRRKIPTSESPVEMPATNGTAESIVQWAKLANLDMRQTKAFVIVMCRFILTFYDDEDYENATNEGDGLSRIAVNQHKREKKRLEKLILVGTRTHNLKKQMIMFLHGPGGSGKSAVIDLVKEYARGFCELLNFPFTKDTIIVTAMSGVAASLLGGNTAHSRCCLMRQPSTEDCVAFRNCRMLILDEISFASAKEIEALHDKLQIMRKGVKRTEQFGGLHILFAGDFRQLEPVNKDSMSASPSLHFEWVNCFIQLNGMHRFSKDLPWGHLLNKFRDGTVTQEDIDFINETCVMSDEKILPEGIQFATYRNRTRDVINTLAFEKYCQDNKDNDGKVKDAILVLSDGLMRKTGNRTWEPVLCQQFFYENLGEDDCETGKFKPRVDPVLKLFRDCPMMLTHNEDVSMNQANGTCATLEQVVLNANETPFLVTLDCGAKVQTVYSSQVQRLVLRHENKDVKEPLFSVKNDTHEVKAKWPLPSSLSTSNKRHEMIPMKLNQFPVVRNTATTGHKLQGKTVRNIFVYEWHYGTNWPYVVLSRVTKMTGVYLREKLKMHPNFEVPIELTQLLARLSEHEPNYDDFNVYEEIAKEQFFHNAIPAEIQ
jgi:hypothetical protein